MTKPSDPGSERPAPSAPGPSDLPPVPTGLQRLLRLAQADPGFLAGLVAHRGAAADAAGIALTASERAILGALPAVQIAALARGLPPLPTERREFLQRSAAAALLLLGGAVIASAGAAGCKGKDRETEPDRPEERGYDMGARDDERPRPEPTPPDAGTAADPLADTRPDATVPRPQPAPTRGIRPDRPPRTPRRAPPR